ncbi:1934_t:CDS:2, partial [Gigaspora rosea]
WTTQGKKELENEVYLYPIRVGWQTVLEISNKNFYTQGDEKHEHQSGYWYQVGLKFSNIEETPSSAIISLYRCVYQNSHTKFFGPQVLGWDNPYILEQLLTANEIGAEVGYTAMFTSDHLGKHASKKLKKFCRTQPFGLEHPLTYQVLYEQRISKCDETYWHNKNIMNHLYNNFLRHYTISVFNGISFLLI